MLLRLKPNKLRMFFAKLKKGKTQTDDVDYVRDSTVEIDPWFPAPPQEPQHVSVHPADGMHQIPLN